MIAAALFVLLLAPTIVSYQSFRPAWDDAYFYDRTACVAQTFYALDGTGLHDCLNGVFKSPIMVFMSLPWGKLGTGEMSVGLSLFSLALFSFALAGLTVFVLRRLGVTWPWLLLVALCLVCNRTLVVLSGQFLVDIPFSWIVTLTLLLIPLEALPTVQKSENVTRGVLWGFLGSLGILSKVSFGPFAPVFLIVLIQRWRKAGGRAALTSLASAVVISIPALLIWALYGASYLEHARKSGFGPEAKQFFAEGTEGILYFPYMADQSGTAIYPLAVLVVLAVGFWFKRRPRVWMNLLPFGFLILYAGLAASSYNRDIRFAMPVMIGLPCLLAVLATRSRKACCGENSATVCDGAGSIPALLLAVLLSVPVVATADMSRVIEARDVSLWFVSRDVKDVAINTDTRAMNIDTFELARRLNQKTLGGMHFSSTVYDHVNQIPDDVSIDKVLKAEGNFFEMPFPAEPGFTNVRDSMLYQKAIDNGYKSAGSAGKEKGWLVAPRFNAALAD